MKVDGIKAFDDMVTRLKEYLEKVPHYSTGTIAHFSHAWNFVRGFMIENKIKHYKGRIGAKALASKFAKRRFEDLAG